MDDGKESRIIDLRFELKIFFYIIPRNIDVGNQPDKPQNIFRQNTQTPTGLSMLFQ